METLSKSQNMHLLRPSNQASLSQPTRQLTDSLYQSPMRPDMIKGTIHMRVGRAATCLLAITSI